MSTNKEQLLCIKTTSGIFYPQKKGVQDPHKREGYFKPYCIIKKLLFGRWKIEFFEDYCPDNSGHKILIIHPSGIESICYSNPKENSQWY